MATEPSVFGTILINSSRQWHEIYDQLVQAQRGTRQLDPVGLNPPDKARVVERKRPDIRTQRDARTQVRERNSISSTVVGGAPSGCSIVFSSSSSKG